MEFTRYYEHMRPRYSNPTYNSSHVGTSLGQVVDIAIPSSTNKQFNQSQLSNMPSRRNNSQSKLSNYGTHSLTSLKKVSDVDIYEKQQKKYNIISNMSLSHHQTIKKYPKYRLENQDINFYRKLQLENQYNQKRYLQKQSQKNNYESVGKNKNNPENKIIQPQYYKPTQLNNSLQNQSFRPKMLNNISELNGVL